LLTGCRHDGVVVTASLILVKAGGWAKTDRRGVVMQAKLHRAGELTTEYQSDPRPCRSTRTETGAR